VGILQDITDSEMFMKQKTKMEIPRRKTATKTITTGYE
jgi:hypothetical protein